MFTLDELLVNSSDYPIKSRADRLEIEAIILQPAKAKREMRIRMKLTPKLAGYWLENYNTHNRPLLEGRWMTIAKDILERRWQYNGDAIRFSSNGSLLDGQTRLKACSESGTAIDVLVIFGLDPKTQDVMDMNRVRRAGEIAHLNDIENANLACAVERMLIIYDQTGFTIEPATGRKVIRHGDGTIKRIIYNRPTRTEIVQGVQKRKGLARIIHETLSWSRTHLLAPRVIGFCHYLFSDQDHDRSIEFFNQILKAENLKRGTPTHWLHSRLIENKSSKTRLLQREIIALLFKAWVAFRDNQSVKVLRWSRNAGEDYPDIKIQATK